VPRGRIDGVRATIQIGDFRHIFMTEPIIQEIPGADSVIRWFGYWPSFHDGEIVEVHLSCQGLSWLKIYTWNTTGKFDSSGYAVTEKHATVAFVFEELTDLEFCDFNQQNVIYDLRVGRRDGVIRLTLSPCYGLNGFIEGKLSRVELCPGELENHDERKEEGKGSP
jgi:hypothetical protein